MHRILKKFYNRVFEIAHHSFKNITTLPCEIQEVIFYNKSSWVFTAATGPVLTAWNWLTPMKNCLLWFPYEPSKLSNICSSGHQEVRHVLAISHACIPSRFQLFIMCCIQEEHGG